VGARSLSVRTVDPDEGAEDPFFSRRAWESTLTTSELEGPKLALRVVGMDWPYSGLTMVGLKRLDDLQECVESVVADGVEGDVIEAGAWRGGASILARATLDSLGADERTVWVADSFQGLPAPNPDVSPEDQELDLSRIDFLAVPAEEVRSYFSRFGLDHGVEFVQGFFDETLPGLRDHRWSIVRVDGDTYEATWVALESLYPGLSTGGYVVLDDYGVIDECQRAVDDYRREHGITEPIEKIDVTGVRWRRESEPTRDGENADGTSRRVRQRSPKRAVSHPARPLIPTEAEHDLESRIEGVRARLGAVEAELDGLRRSAVPKPAGRARSPMGEETVEEQE
jgi:O-methyltransferase